jgi:hypothetical protein
LLLQGGRRSRTPQLKKKLICNITALLFSVLGELGNDPAERTVPSVDPMNLNQVILAEGKTV